METERKRPRRRERRGSRRSSHSQQSPEIMLVDGPGASAPSPDTKAVIARSKSRYKGARPRPPRSISTPSVPAVPPVEASGDYPADKGKTRPNTTFDGLHNTPATDDEDEPLIRLIQGSNGLRSPRNQVQSLEALKETRPVYTIQEPRTGSSRKPSSSVTHPERRSTDSHQRYSREKSQTYKARSQHTSTDQEVVGQGSFATEQERHRAVLPTRPAMIPKKSFTQRIAGLVSQPQSAAEAKAELKRMISHPIPMEDVTPPPAVQFDAPKSAVNAGERTVRVKYKEFQVPVSIVPSTTPADVIRSVSEKVATPLDPASSVMLESFKQLGLERPLRRYEHIRDVLNSWDSDSQNTLIIEPSETGGHDDDLDIRNVPRKQPNDSSFYLYHSQRPGHWDKREVTLRSDGQMLIAKSRGAETTNICHLSDFDIYIPTARQMAKKICPPKRICFAVKSQQKSNMFMSTVNFVHFFSSNDRKMAKALYNAVQEWRSWYLVNMMGKGVEESNQPVDGGRKQTVGGKVHARNPCGAIQQSQRLPGIPANQLAPPTPSAGISNMSARHLAQDPITHTLPPARQNITPQEPRDRPGPSASIPRSSATGASAEAPFADGGLLGRNYTHRKKAQQGYEIQPADAPTQWPTSSPSPVKSSTNELKRTSSQLKKPKPLIDLTPQYQEPPQHVRKGRGVTPGQIPAGGLVDIATSPEVAIQIPPTTSWRKPSTSSGPETSPPRNRSDR
ncbi:MAG: hypothetical protein Q9225_000763 [Loekoesia sp. 1 TL-2023]